MMHKIGFLFPGQGAQMVGMGKDLAGAFPETRRLFEEADLILGYSLRRICFEGSEEELTRTLYAQPAIFVASVAALAALRTLYPDIRPAFAAGLSLGEFTALFAAGAVSFEDALRLVKTRAEAMEEAALRTPGTMASVMGLDQEHCEEVAAEAGCQVANLNAPDQFVLSGTVESIEKACALAEKRGAKRAIRLKVGGAFHSALMLYAKERLEEALANTLIRPPQCPFVPNAKAAPVSDVEEIRTLLAKQLTNSVRWIETMACAKALGVHVFLEVGPGKVLKGLARRSQPEFQVHPCGTAEDIRGLEPVLGPVTRT